MLPPIMSPYYHGAKLIGGHHVVILSKSYDRAFAGFKGHMFKTAHARSPDIITKFGVNISNVSRDARRRYMISTIQCIVRSPMMRKLKKWIENV
jgi:hypothetical protein